jgi:hypothetical protein
MQSYKIYKEFMANLGQVKEALRAEITQLENQLSIFQNEFEAATLMQDDKRQTEASKRMKLSKMKLTHAREKLNNLEIKPLAEQVFAEGEKVLLELSEQLSLQFTKAIEARELYLREIRKLAEIRSRSMDVHNMTIDCAVHLRRNALAPIQIRGFHIFQVLKDDLIRILK